MLKMLCALSIFNVTSAMALNYEAVKVAVWKKGETIMGEEFVAATEAVADYVSALPRPTEPFKPNRFDCQVKGRVIQPTVHTNGTTPPPISYTNIITIYDIKDCVAIRD